jgi:hypothetical protein
MKNKTKILFFFLILCGTIFGNSDVQAVQSPVVLFSDLTDAPTSGWEGSAIKGAAVSIYGRNFGSSRGSSYITVGGVSLTNDSDYAEWGATENPSVRLGMKRITFYLNSSIPTDGIYPNSEITITTSDGTSNALKFHTRALGASHIYFFDDTNGNDLTCNGLYSTNLGSGNCPKKTPGWYRANAVAGDIGYFRNTSTYQTVDDDGLYARAHMQMRGVGRFNNGSEGLSISVVSYPGEEAYWYAPNTGTPDAADNFTKNVEMQWADIRYWNFAKLKWYFYDFAWGMDPSSSVNNMRFVGMDVSSYGDWQGSAWNMCSGGGLSGTDAKTSGQLSWLGNWIHDLGPGSAPTHYRHYPIYLNGYGQTDYVYYGYNEFGPLPNTMIDDEHGGSRAFDIYGHTAADVVDHVYIFNNYAHHMTRQPMAIGNGDGAPNFLRNIYFYNNIIGSLSADAGETTISMGAGYSDQTLANLKFYNNTFDSRNQTHEFLWDQCDPALAFKNNIIVADLNGDAEHFTTLYNFYGCPTTISTRFTGSNNAWYGNLIHDGIHGGGLLNETSVLTNNDPKFTNSTPSTFSDYILQETSPVIDGGIDLSADIPEETIAGMFRVGLNKDFYAAERGNVYDIGAFEYASAEEPTETCTDNIQNQDETGIDCGGVCEACVVPITYGLSNFVSAITNWLQIGNETSDVNSDGVVNTRDLGVVMSNWSN